MKLDDLSQTGKITKIIDEDEFYSGRTLKSYLSSRVEQIIPSGIRRFFDMANRVEGVISLGVGEPDFVTQWSICETVIRSLEKSYTSYTD